MYPALVTSYEASSPNLRIFFYLQLAVTFNKFLPSSFIELVVETLRQLILLHNELISEGGSQLSPEN